MKDLRTSHPCFNDEARQRFARIHLPVAPACNVSCNFCNRKYDCMNESRPGVTSTLLTPSQAEEYVRKATELMPNISVVGIAGPGDPFAQPDVTLETLSRVRKSFPEMLLCVASNGLNVAPYVDELKQLNVSHVTITINAIYPTIGAQIYAWVRKNKRVYRGEDGAKELLVSQLEAVDKLIAAGITTKINTIVIPGVNQDHVVDIAKAMKKRGADIMNCMPLYPVEGARFANLKAPKKAVMKEILTEVEKHLPIMSHCARCRADAAGLIGCRTPKEVEALLLSAGNPDTADRPYVAAASREGLLVNQHLGEADFFRVFSKSANGGFEEVEQRIAPASGGGDARWLALAELLKDCRALLVSECGERPKLVLEKNGLKVIPMEGLLDTGLQAVYEGRSISMPSLKKHRCGVGCSGDGMGCG